jgi:hypothetical protein
MPSDAALTTSSPVEMTGPIGAGFPLTGLNSLVNDAKSLCSTLSRELRFANADYRMLALHAGPSHDLTLDAKQRAAKLAAQLRAETEKLRSQDRPLT